MIQKSRRPPGRPRAFKAEDALDKAIPVFWAKGYEGASLDDLTEAMGIRRPSLYAAFGDKEQLFLRCLARYGETVGARGLFALEGAADVHEAVRRYLRQAAHSFVGCDAPPGCLVGSVALATDNPTVRQFVWTSLQGAEATLAEHLQQGVDRGELPAGFPVARRARRLVDASMSLALRARSGDGLDVLLTDADELAALVLSAA